MPAMGVAPARRPLPSGSSQSLVMAAVSLGAKLSLQGRQIPQTMKETAMKLQIGYPTQAGTQKRFGNGMLAAARNAAPGAAALAAALAFVAVHGWSMSQRQPLPSTRAVQSLALQAGRASAPSMAGGAMTYYLVGSAEQANLVELRLQAEAANPLVAAGKVLQHEIIVVGSPEDEAHMRQTVDSGVEAAGHGGPLPQIIDLRGQ